MSPEAAHNLSIRDLLRVLSEKLGLECTRIRDIPPSHVVSAAELEAEIESLETRVHDVLRFIPSLRNALQPVNRLPPEILSRVARDIPGDFDDDARTIIPLTHVCRYWRESIVSAPGNWAMISSSHRNLAALSLERAKAAPLEIYLDMYEIQEDPQFLDLLIPHLQNTKILRCCYLATIEDFVQAFPDFPRSTPALRSLGLAYDDNGPLWNPSADPFESFPDTLTSLSLRDIPLYPSLLKLRTLTELSLRYHRVYPPLDILLDILGRNRSLESVHLVINFEGIPTGIPQRRAVIMDRLQCLSITCRNAMVTRILISNVSLRRGAHLEIIFRGPHTESGFDDTLSDISSTHLSNLLSPSFMEYKSSPRVVRLIGPNGSFSYNHHCYTGVPFEEFPVLPLTNVQELRLAHSEPYIVFHPSSFPALEILTIQCNTDVSLLFSTLFPNPSCFPSLKTLGFLDCDVADGFMDELTRFASDRKNTASAWLCHVLIVQWDGKFPSAASIRRLRNGVATVEVRIGNKLPADLT